MKRKFLIISAYAMLALILVLVKSQYANIAPVVESTSISSVHGGSSRSVSYTSGQFVLKFFRDYLENDYGSLKWLPVINYVDGHYMVSNSYVEIRSQSGLFSRNYISASQTFVEKCNEGLVAVKKEDVEKWGGSPAALATNNSCNFVSRTPFVDGSQIPLDTVEILNSSETQNTAVVVVALRWSKSSLDDRFAKVSLVKEHGNWKIDSIKNSFVRPTLN
jgi:hypothetical protein